MRGDPHGRGSLDSGQDGLAKDTTITLFSRQVSVPGRLLLRRESENFGRGRAERSNRAKATRRFSDHHRASLVAKFKLVGRLVIACHRLAEENKFSNKKYEQLFPYVRTLNFHDYDDNDGDGSDEKVLLFNPNRFKANKQLRMPEDARRILSKSPTERTKSELAYLKTVLLSIRSYSEYPVRMQRQIAEVGMYERFESKRMILRQGHPPTSVYFILSGSVVIMVREADFPESMPIAYRGKGDTFGELAILGKSRQSSVISKETIELLTISVDDFKRIFMRGGVRNLTDPDHLEFLRSLEMMRDWPIEKLVSMSNPKEAVLMYFRRGEVLVRDSRHLESLVIVKSGSVKVLKRMQLPKTRRRQPNAQTHTHPGECDLPPPTKHELHYQSAEHVTPQTRREVEQLAREAGHILTEVRVRRRKPPNADVGHELPEIRNTKFADRKSMCVGNWSTGSGIRDGDWKEAASGEQIKRGKRRKPGGTDNGGKNTLTRADKQKEEEREQDQEMMGRKQHVRNIAEDLDAKNNSEDSEDDSLHQFIHIQTLKKGEAFGLANLLLDDQPSLCVVSEGAECIMLNRKFYLRHASDKLIEMLRINCPPYPSEDELLDNFRRSIDWIQFKKKLLHETIDDISSARSQKKSFRLPVPDAVRRPRNLTDNHGRRLGLSLRMPRVYNIV